MFFVSGADFSPSSDAGPLQGVWTCVVVRVDRTGLKHSQVLEGAACLGPLRELSGLPVCSILYSRLLNLTGVL